MSKEPVKLDDEQLAELREIFRSFDRNNDGSLTQLELGSLLRSLGLKPSPDQLETLIQKADTNSNGLVEFSEFVALVAPELLPAKSPYTEEQLKQLFRMFDRDGNGFITAAELAHSMAKLGHALTAEELTGMIREADTDGDGRISFQEFSQAITSAALDRAPKFVCRQMILLCSITYIIRKSDISELIILTRKPIFTSFTFREPSHSHP
ncbi:hypothetical protein HYC85_027030 [Camellia sinensis]|uniref:EF-hand domain-containing protein n=1 Tax=Camellia sinensis TaxID=4442 RepID=A0A7J7G7J3_CAMSI|nr:hypothetical protein HYC85_027030 [Camellia sinensis]